MIIGITGTNGSGKGAVVDYLVNQKNFFYFSNSGYLAHELESRGVEKTRPNLRAIGNEYREKFGSGYLAKKAIELAQIAGAENIVIEAIRSVGEATIIKNSGGKLLVIDADRKERYRRIHERKSSKDLIDFDTFVEQEEKEWFGAEGEFDMNMKAVMAMADYTILNEGTIKELHQLVEEYLNKIDK